MYEYSVEMQRSIFVHVHTDMQISHTMLNRARLLPSHTLYMYMLYMYMYMYAHQCSHHVVHYIYNI